MLRLGWSWNASPEPTENPMTEERMALVELLQKADEAIFCGRSPVCPSRPRDYQRLPVGKAPRRSTKMRNQSSVRSIVQRRYSRSSGYGWPAPRRLIRSI
jgi:hypothetical protein